VREFVKKEGKNSHIMQLFSGFTDDKPVVIGLSE